MKKIKIAQIGTGHDHAGMMFETLRKMSDVFDVVGFAQVPEDNGAFQANNYKGAREFTVDEILSMTDLDAIVVETFDLNLVKYAQKVADKGINIQMDKAGGEDYIAFEKLLSTVKSKGLVFNMGYMYRFNPMIIDLFNRVNSGQIGKIYSIDAEMSCYHGKQKREWLCQLKSGMMQFLGCHLIDLIVRLQGVPDEIIPYNSATGKDGVNCNDLGFAVLKYKNGISTVKSSALDAGGAIRRHFIVCGENGTLSVAPIEAGISGDYPFLSPLYSKITDQIPDDGWFGVGRTTTSQVFDRYEGLLNHFASMLRGEATSVVDLETEARVQRCILVAGGFDCDYKAKINL